MRHLTQSFYLRIVPSMYASVPIVCFPIQAASVPPNSPSHFPRSSLFCPMYVLRQWLLMLSQKASSIQRNDFTRARTEYYFKRSTAAAADCALPSGVEHTKSGAKYTRVFQYYSVQVQPKGKDARRRRGGRAILGPGVHASVGTWNRDAARKMDRSGRRDLIRDALCYHASPIPVSPTSWSRRNASLFVLDVAANSFRG